MQIHSHAETVSKRLQRGIVATLFLAAYTLSAVAPFVSTQAVYAEDVQTQESVSVEGEVNPENIPAPETKIENQNKSDSKPEVKVENENKPEKENTQENKPEPKPVTTLGEEKKQETPFLNSNKQEGNARNNLVIIDEEDDETPVTLKDWVCKYVGKPGVNERLKTGNDGLVWVDESATESGWFNDAQDRSYVLLANAPHDPKPDASQCPAPDGPDATPYQMPTVQVVCGPNNDIVTLPVSEHVTYTQTGWVNGKNTVTATAHEGYYLQGTEGDTQKVWVLTDENTDCPVLLAEPTVQVVCGPNNDIVTLPEVAHIDYTQSGWVNGQTTVTASTHDGYFFQGTQGQTEKTWTFTDENTSCGEVLGEITTTPNILAGGSGAALQDTGNDMLLPMFLSTGILGLAIMTMLKNSPQKRSSRLAAMFRRASDQMYSAFAQPFSVAY